ncbi:MAG TPA: CpsB/CapC family capsule biosynthesis tyrosine phosphatase [Bryobacteraceae bacterium]|nr:CpsB/CapC family capsule biosynthesis tyrosine phosphatase [Bryobacteraceae bacterium]
MIDIHSHILPGLDDGSPDMAESVAMAKLAAECGTTDLVASPHADLQYAFDPAIVERKIAELTEAAGGVIRIHYGCDFHLHYENVQDALANPSKYAVNHKNYVLVELSELLVLKTADDVLERMRAAGMIPIITHPERNTVLQHRLEKLQAWAGNGCLIQVTGQSLLGRFGRKAHAFSVELLRRNLAHFVASDGHDCQNRPPRLDDSFAWVRDQFGAGAADRLFTANPAAVLAGEDLPPEDSGAGTAPRKWWRPWK